MGSHMHKGMTGMHEKVHGHVANAVHGMKSKIPHHGAAAEHAGAVASHHGAIVPHHGGAMVPYHGLAAHHGATATPMQGRTAALTAAHPTAVPKTWHDHAGAISGLMEGVGSVGGAASGLWGNYNDMKSNNLA